MPEALEREMEQEAVGEIREGFAEDAREPSLEDDEHEELRLDIGGYEGPLDLLLELARRQRVDLREISVLALAEQYLTYIQSMQRLLLLPATEYLLMAVWLAYLKSALLLPREEEEEPDAEEMAARLAARLELLAAMREKGAELMRRPRLGRQVRCQGSPQTPRLRLNSIWQASLPDILDAYAQVRARDSYEPLHLERPPLVPVEQAIKRLLDGLAPSAGWLDLTALVLSDWRAPSLVRSAVGSLFSAALETTRQGQTEIAQTGAFTPVRLRRLEEAEQ